MDKYHFTGLIIGLLILSQSTLYSQFGVRMKYNNINYRGLAMDPSVTVPSYHLETGLDYWFRLKKRRIEFMPEIFYALPTHTVPTQVLTGTKSNYFGIILNTQFYPLDLDSDCNCPTFSKSGSGFDKGFFVHLSAGFVRHIFDPTAPTTPQEPMAPPLVLNKENQNLARIGGGLGLDIGINDLLTLTPMVSYYFHSTMTNGFSNALGANAVDINPTLLQFTLRLGFRPDYGKRR